MILDYCLSVNITGSTFDRNFGDGIKVSNSYAIGIIDSSTNDNNYSGMVINNCYFQDLYKWTAISNKLYGLVTTTGKFVLNF